MNKLLLLLCLFAFPAALRSQVLPKENSALNYRIIGFFPDAPRSAAKFSLDIALGTYYSEDSFRKNIIKKVRCDKGKIVEEVPFFGRSYTWRAAYYVGSRHVQSKLYHFFTASIPEVDPAKTRLRIMTPAEKHKNAFIFLDKTRVLYDMSGKPVWFLPDVDVPIADDKMCDLKLSPFNTITFLLGGQNIYEVDYDGNVLWKGPNDGKVSGAANETYHHEFTRLSNGRYMVLGTELVKGKDIGAKTDSSLLTSEAGEELLPFGTIIEYDSKGNIVWKWKAADYFKQSDLLYHTPGDTRYKFNTHDNGFFFDEKESVIYLSFRDISRVIKIKYPEGTVIKTYGEIFHGRPHDLGNGLFSAQHSPRVSRSGDLYMFNNKGDRTYPPTVLILHQPQSDSERLTKVWEYECNTDGMGVDGQNIAWMVKGGNVLELPDNSLLVCMGSQFSKIFIVDRDKKILWCAASEKWNDKTQRWDMIEQYRASIVDDRTALERIIWRDETNTH